VSVVIIDSGGANIASLQAALGRLGAESRVSSDPDVIRRAPRVLLPGVGSAHDAMSRLRIAGLEKLIPQLKQPLLGICLGMQILFERSEEGPANCLGVIPGSITRLQSEPGRPVPHMGWNQMTQVHPDPLLDIRRHGGHHRLRRGLHRRRAPREFLRHAIPSRTLRRGRFAHPRKLPQIMILIPSIDLRNGRCVRLLKGNFDAETRYDLEPHELLQRYRALGASWLHVVDLDGAKDGQLANRSVIVRLASQKALLIQVGGGVRSAAVVDDLLRNGIDRVIVGSAAVEKPAEVQAWLKKYGAEKIGLAFDIRHDRGGVPRVLTRGWTRESKLSLWEAIDSYLPHGLKHVLCTDAELDGAMQGPAVNLYAEGVKRYPQIAWQASGGVRNAADLAALAATGSAAAISGKALLEEMISPSELRPFLPNA
jgi:phosphoribosylformimino-5-aminoimidazole carboxamide ribotide isomerase